MSRYEVTGSEGQFEPGSNEKVLANKLGITNPQEMDEVESRLLMQLYKEVLPNVSRDQPLTTALIKEWHRKWLGNVYTWAGELRTVNLAKGGFPFASVPQLTKLLVEFDQQVLATWTPCCDMDQETLTKALAVVHVELVVIHPFREGNGRIARFVADAMASQAKFAVLNYSTWDRGENHYVKAIHAGVDHNYAPMEALFKQALDS